MTMYVNEGGGDGEFSGVDTIARADIAKVLAVPGAVIAQGKNVFADNEVWEATGGSRTVPGSPTSANMVSAGFVVVDDLIVAAAAAAATAQQGVDALDGHDHSAFVYPAIGATVALPDAGKDLHIKLRTGVDENAAGTVLFEGSRYAQYTPPTATSVGLRMKVDRIEGTVPARLLGAFRLDGVDHTGVDIIENGAGITGVSIDDGASGFVWEITRFYDGSYDDTDAFAAIATAQAAADAAKTIPFWDTLTTEEKQGLGPTALVLNSDNEIKALSVNAANIQMPLVANNAARDSITGMAHGDHVVVSDTGRQHYYNTIPTIPAWVETGSYLTPVVPANGSISPAIDTSSWDWYGGDLYRQEITGRNISPLNNKIDKREIVLSDCEGLFRYPAGLPDGFVIEWNVPYALMGRYVDLVIGDGSVEKLAGLDGSFVADGRARLINQAGLVAFRKSGNIWRQFKASHYNIATGPGLMASGSVDSTSAYVLRVVVNEALYGVPPYSAYTVIISLLHEDHAGRTITLTGDDLSLPPVTVVDTAPADKVTLTYASTYVGPDGVVIGGVARNNGATSIKALYGTLGSFDIVSNIARLYGDIDITISVADASGCTATETL